MQTGGECDIEEESLITEGCFSSCVSMKSRPLVRVEKSVRRHSEKNKDLKPNSHRHQGHY